MSFVRIEALLKEKMGLDAASVGAASVERAVRQRLDAHGETADTYWNRVSASEDELQELIEAVVVGETWFFRDREAFTLLVRLALEEWLGKHPTGTFRVLSLPCSTGEEPYSMAMALLDAGFLPQQFHIDAVDISARAIAYAERGVYGRNSFRGQDVAFRDRYFSVVPSSTSASAAGPRYSLNEQVRGQVKFSHGNMLAAGWLPGAHTYDAIFCRNVLIYFDRPTQDRALGVLGRLLQPTGILFVGPSETALLMDHAFVSVPAPRAFAFRKPQPAVLRAGNGPTVDAARHSGRAPGARVASSRKSTSHNPPSKMSSSQGSSSVPKSVATPSPPAAKGNRQPSAAVTSASSTSKQDPSGESWIADAQRLADEGKLMEAMGICEQHLRQSPASAEAFYLVGLLHDAAHHPREAAEYYRKALYLDPRHHEALVHLAVVLENEGDARGAQRLFERAKRATAK